MNPWGNRCWLLTSPRTGSTWLQFLLNKNAGVPLKITDDLQQSRFSFGEHMSEKYCQSLEDFMRWDPFVSKVHCHHFGAYLVDRSVIQQRVQGVRFVLLERRDSIEQAVSLALSNRTGVTQANTSQKLRQFRAQRIELSDEELLGCYEAVRDYLDFWRNWIYAEPHLVVTYESLVQNPRATIAQILDFLRVDYEKIELDVPLNKLGHPSTPAHVNRLKSLLLRRTNCSPQSYRQVDNHGEESPKAAQQADA